MTNIEALERAYSLAERELEAAQCKVQIIAAEYRAAMAGMSQRRLAETTAAMIARHAARAAADR